MNKVWRVAKGETRTGRGHWGRRVRRKAQEKGEDRVNTCGFKQRCTIVSLTVCYLFDFFKPFIRFKKMEKKNPKRYWVELGFNRVNIS